MIEALLGAVPSAVIGAIAVYIAWQQHKIDGRREEREARQSRLEVYRKVKLFLGKVDRTLEFDDKDYQQLTEALAQADFLFSAGVIGWLEEVLLFADRVTEAEEMLWELRRSIGLPAVSEAAAREANPDLFNRLTQDREEALHALQQLHCQLKDTFASSLGNRYP